MISGEKDFHSGALNSYFSGAVAGLTASVVLSVALAVSVATEWAVDAAVLSTFAASTAVLAAVASLDPVSDVLVPVVSASLMVFFFLYHFCVASWAKLRDLRKQCLPLIPPPLIEGHG